MTVVTAFVLKVYLKVNDDTFNLECTGVMVSV